MVRAQLNVESAVESASTVDSLTAEPSSSQTLAQQLAQQLVEELTIRSQDWHRLKSNRQARAQEQVAVALVYLLKNEPQEALERLQLATGWLDRSISAPPCPTHGNH